MKNLKKWTLHRRGFLKSVLAAGAASQIPWWMACSPIKKVDVFILTEKQLDILKIVQDFLFPSDGNGPSANDLKAEAYLQWVLFDPEMDPEDKNYIIKGINWVDETAQEEQEMDFLELKKVEQWNLLNFIAQTEWGESWFSILLNFIFEALLSDPIYGSNSEKIGWIWLDHNPGIPRPNLDQKYGAFLHFVNHKNPPHV